MEDPVDAYAETLFLAIHPTEDFASLSFEEQSRYFQSARIILDADPNATIRRD